MSPALPDGEKSPIDGSLPSWAGAGSKNRGFSIYIHVPFCKVRCGYCDFNTYTATELGGGANQLNYARTAASEIALAARVLDQSAAEPRPVNTVFFGGGTPTLLPAEDLAFLLERVRDAWGLAADAEITTEANPDSVDQQYLQTLADAGFTRVSFGMQSAVPHVLETLERTHDASRIPDVVAWAKAAGLQVSLDLIYGTPGESDADWLRSLEVAVSCAPDHISAYALVVEEGTKMAVQVRRGELELPSLDAQADRYEVADQFLSAAGYDWYEVSNWARTAENQCRHNIAYWSGDDWWGIGPGAHSYLGSATEVVDTTAAANTADAATATAAVNSPDLENLPGGVRWWNVKHPRAYADRLAAGESPSAGREVLTGADTALETIMLQIRLSRGLPITAIDVTRRHLLEEFATRGLIMPDYLETDRVTLTLRGRLMADAVVRDLTL